MGNVCTIESKMFRVVIIKGQNCSQGGRLQCLGMVWEEGNVCPIFRFNIEESRHLFVQCARVYSVWVRVALLLNMNFVWVGDIA